MKTLSKVYLDKACERTGRIALSNGVAVAPADNHPLAYESLAYVPQGPWREVETDQLDDLLQTDHPADLRDHLAVVKLDQDTIELGRKIRIQYATSFGGLEQIIRSDIYAYNDFMAGIANFYTRYERTDTRRHKIGFDIGLANQETTTINRDVNMKTGMHVDIWDNYNLHAAREATNRICINLGREDRYFLYVNLTLDQVYERVSQHPDFNTQVYRQGQLVQLFFKYFPAYPVNRVRVAPFEAYIAPTENLIHDGSTSGSKSCDITYTVRGDFQVA